MSKGREGHDSRIVEERSLGRSNVEREALPEQGEPSLERTERARRYFSQPGFEQMLQAVWNRYAGLEKPGGHAVVRKASADECERLNEFFGWYKKPGEDIRVPLALFERELLHSAFPFTIAELHEVLNGKPLMTKSDLKLLAQQDWQALFQAVEDDLTDKGTSLQPQVSAWLAGLKEGRALGYRTLRDLWHDSGEAAKRELAHAVRAWNLLLSGETGVFSEGDGAAGTFLSSIRLPVLAALTTGNPHALDRNNPAGRLFFQALRSANRYEVLFDIESGDATDLIDPEESEAQPALSFVGDTLEARRVYRLSGILDDDISSLVHVYRPYSGLKGPYVLTLRQVESTKAFISVTDIYVVENPAVFSTLADWTESIEACYASSPLLLCTSGPASAASLRLIDRYMEDGLFSGDLYYSGDYDVKGIEIGNVLAARYKERFVPWCFSGDSYLEGQAQFLGKGVAFTQEDRLRLERMQAVWDETLCKAMAEAGCKLFQEQLVLRLLEDWKKAIQGEDQC